MPAGTGNPTIKTDLNSSKSSWSPSIFRKHPTLDEVLNEETVSPYSLHDFRLYLFNVEHSIENLEFLLWFDSFQIRYYKLFENDVVNGKVGVEWEVDESRLPDSILRDRKRPKDRLSFISTNRSRNKVQTHSSPVPVKKVYAALEDKSSSDVSVDTLNESMVKVPPSVEKPKPAQLQLINKIQGEVLRPFINSPTFYQTNICPSHLAFSGELNTINAIFLAPCAPLELNLPYSIKKGTLSEMQHSSHPDKFAPIAHQCYQMLASSFPQFLNFVKRSKCGCDSGRRVIPTLLFTFLGLALAGGLIVLGVSRWVRIATFPFFFIALMIYFITNGGPCFIQLLKIMPTTIRCQSNPDSAFISHKPHFSLSGQVPKSPVHCGNQWGKDPFFKLKMGLDSGKSHSYPSYPAISKSKEMDSKPCSMFKKSRCDGGELGACSLNINNDYQFSSSEGDEKYGPGVHRHGWACLITGTKFAIALLLAALLSTALLFVPNFYSTHNFWW